MTDRKIVRVRRVCVCHVDISQGQVELAGLNTERLYVGFFFFSFAVK